jgi:hypothetical protein
VLQGAAGESTVRKQAPQASKTQVAKNKQEIGAVPSTSGGVARPTPAVFAFRKFEGLKVTGYYNYSIKNRWGFRRPTALPPGSSFFFVDYYM